MTVTDPQDGVLPIGEDLVLEVEVRGERWTGWLSIEVLRAVDAAAGRFRLSTVPSRTETWPIRPQDEVTIRIGGEELVTGHVDELRATSSVGGREVTVAGRDRTADLVDCAAVTTPGTWFGAGLEEIVRELATPYGVQVIRLTSRVGEPFDVFKLQVGESAWAAIERAARARSVLTTTDGQGRLILTTPGVGQAEVDLVEGGPGANVLSSSFRWNLESRYRTYLVRGQGRGSDDGWGDEVAAIEGEAQDLEILRERTTLVISDGPLTFSDAEDLARWTAAHARARSIELDVTVLGWLQYPDGPPWRPNETVIARIPSIGVEGRWLIRSVRHSRDREASARTILGLVPEDAYDPIAEIPAGRDPVEDLLIAPDPNQIQFSDEIENL